MKNNSVINKNIFGPIPLFTKIKRQDSVTNVD